MLPRQQLLLDRPDEIQLHTSSLLTFLHRICHILTTQSFHLRPWRSLPHNQQLATELLSLACKISLNVYSPPTLTASFRMRKPSVFECPLAFNCTSFFLLSSRQTRHNSSCASAINSPIHWPPYSVSKTKKKSLARRPHCNLPLHSMFCSHRRMRKQAYRNSHTK